MSDRRWVAILCLATSGVILIYPLMSDTFGPRMTNYIEEALGVYHSVAVALQICAALGLLYIGLWLMLPIQESKED